MRVVIEQSQPWGPYVDVYMIEESQFSNRLLVFKGPDEAGRHVMESVPLDEAVSPPSPSFTLDQRWIPALIEALTQKNPVKADAVLLNRLDKESERVDKMLDHLLAMGAV